MLGFEAMPFGPMAQGLIFATKILLWVLSVALVASLIPAHALSLADSTTDRSKWAFLKGTAAPLLIVVFFVAVMLFDCRDETCEWYSAYLDLRGWTPPIITFVLLLAWISEVLCERTARRLFLISIPFGAFGGAVGFLFGYPSFGQTTVAGLIGPLFAALGSAGGAILLGKSSQNIFGPSGFKGNKAISAISAFALSSFVIFVACGIWGYSREGFDRCLASWEAGHFQPGPLGEIGEAYRSFCHNVITGVTG